jgi:5'-nucleotidase (lipoprotein e(P4) family)
MKSWILAAAVVAAALPIAAQPVATREQLNAVLWQQTAVEFMASSAQAYRLATGRIDAVKRERTRSASVEQQAQGGFSAKPGAVLLDIDETVLDNSAYNAGLLSTGTSFDAATWNAWVLQRAATALPGARDFIMRARRAGLRVVYISNRECRSGVPFDAQGESTDCPQKAATLDNLEAELGYRPASRDLLLRRQRAEWADSDKTARRAEVAKTHRIAMLLGDDLNDFIPRPQYQAGRDAAHWGGDWFMLPNPAYGSWERGLPIDRSAAASDGCHRQLDQLVISKLLKQAIGGALPAARLVAGPPGASDHCRIETTLPAAP